MRFFLIVVFLIWPALTTAQCGGEDLRPSLTHAEKAALADAKLRTPFAEGNHWLAEQNGQTIRVIGTMHIGDPRMAALSARLAPHVAAADVLYLEISAAEEKRMERFMATDPSLLLLTDTTLPEELDEATWNVIAEAARARGLPPFMAAKMQPWYLSVMLSLPGCLLQSMTENASEGLDDRLAQTATDANVPMRSLERFEDVISVFTEEPFETQVSFLVSSIVPEDVSADMMATTAEVYFDETNAESWALSRVLSERYMNLPADKIETAFADFEQKLLVNRNLSWMEHIDAAAEQSIVVAVGALHLMGESGVLNQLAQRGFTLTRQPF